MLRNLSIFIQCSSILLNYTCHTLRDVIAYIQIFQLMQLVPFFTKNTMARSVLCILLLVHARVGSITYAALRVNY